MSDTEPTTPDDSEEEPDQIESPEANVPPEDVDQIEDDREVDENG